LVYDRDTGRPKGFGFAEYLDPETASSAVRNLNNHEVQGRKLKVDFSHEGNAAELENLEREQQGLGGLNGGASEPLSTGAPVGHGGLPPLPPGVPVPPGSTALEAISRTMSTLPPTQLHDILVQMKQLVATDSNRAIELLRQAPQLSYAVFQALLQMNLVDTSIIAQVIEPGGAAAAPPPPPPQPIPTPIPAQVVTPNPYYAPPVPPIPVPTPPVPQQEPMDAQKAALIQQVMSLTPEQIANLPPDQQQIILALRQKFMGGGM
jgi:cleavage stimulation factor subunit 2